MKKIILVLILFSASAAMCQTAPYNVVFDVTSSDTVVHKMVMRWVSAIHREKPDANIEVVFYGKSLDMITRDRSIVSDSVMKYAANKYIKFRVCEGAMKNNKVERSALIDGVETVPDGIYEIVQRQFEGYAYIKAAR